MYHKPTKNMRDITRDELIALRNECLSNFYLRGVLHNMFLDVNKNKTEFIVTLPKEVEDNPKIRDATNVLTSYGLRVSVYPGKYNIFGSGTVEFEVWVPVGDMKWFLKDASGRSLWKDIIAI